MGWIAGAWAAGAWANTAWATQDAPVEVPDVVGETQAAGTSTLEAEGFVVSVGTAYSPSVPAGTIISQSPTGGSFANEGSTVTITVSLGPEPEADEVFQTPAGRKKKRYEVEIDGRVFPVDSYAEAERLLMRARDLARVAAPEVVKRAAIKARRKKRPLTVNAPIVSTNDPELESLVSQYSQSIEALYSELARDAEIRQLLRRKLAEEADEEESILLLLH